jgi:DNA invertase Pin-like site-specific DNA recombinase
MVIYAYFRVSSDGQDLHNQQHGILGYANTHGLNPIRFVKDTVSGREKWQSRTASSNDAIAPFYLLYISLEITS